MGTRARRTILRGSIIILMVLMLIGCVHAAPILSGYETRITTVQGDQYDPAIWDTIIVFTDYRAADTDVYYHDLGDGEHPVIVAPGNQELTDVANGIIVYTDYRSSDIRAFDVSSGTTTEITKPDKENSGRVFNSVDPATDGTIVAWQDNRDGNNEIYAKDLETGEERRITDATDVDSRPAVSDGRIVWQRCMAGATCDIWSYDWASETTTQITNTPSVNEMNPDVNGQNIVYQTNVNGNSDIAVFNLNTRMEQVPPLEQAQANPHVWAENVAMDDLSGGLYHITLWNIPSGGIYHLTSGMSGQYLNSIWDTRVAYTDDRNGDLEIYMFTFTLTPSETPAQAIQDLIDYIVRLNLPKGTTNSLTKKLDGAMDGLARGDSGAAVNKLNAFINEVQAQRCKKIPCDEADTLIARAGEIIWAIQNPTPPVVPTGGG
jgi:TolB protein